MICGREVGDDRDGAEWVGEEGRVEGRRGVDRAGQVWFGLLLMRVGVLTGSAGIREA